MFRWCAYCQHLIGEAEPLDSYEMTHGCCPDCEAKFDTFAKGIDPAVLSAKGHFQHLMRAGRSGNLSVIEAFIRSAKSDGLRNSDILVGLVQPALYEIGRLWQKGEVTVADEHRFTSFCVEIYSRLPSLPTPPGPAAILLALAPDNRHDFGIHILKHLAEDKGVPCRLLPVGTPASEIVAAVLREKPALFGLSMAMSSSLADVSGLLSLCSKAAPDMRLTIGGLFVRELPANSLPGVKIARRLDDFMAELTAIAPAS